MRAAQHSSPSMKQVHSSHVHAVGYDNANQELHVEYKGGNRYVYKNVPADKADTVMNSHSIGSALHTHIKGQHDHDVL